jgi:hypothetical protein
MLLRHLGTLESGPFDDSKHFANVDILSFRWIEECPLDDTHCVLGYNVGISMHLPPLCI